MPRRKQDDPARVAAQIDRINSVLGTGADPAARRLYLFGEVDDAAAARLMVALNVMDSDDGPITVYLHTYGGSVESGFAIFDTVRLAQNDIVMVGFGAVQSMGAIIMQSADLRLMAPQARFMVHTGSVVLDGEQDSDKMISMGEEIASIRERAVDVLASRSSLTRKKVKEMLIKETYLSADEALEAGFIDGVLAPEPKDTKPQRVSKKAKK